MKSEITVTMCGKWASVQIGNSCFDCKHYPGQNKACARYQSGCVNFEGNPPLEDALQARITELEAENARLKSEIVSKDKKLTDYEKELRKLHNYDKTCSTCRYLDENQNCVLGIRCVNYALWQGRIL